MTTVDPLLHLACLVIQTLDAQQQYFRSRSFADLGTSKSLEAKLREMAAIIVQGSSQPSLFDAEIES